jgi:hypothetical protein
VESVTAASLGVALPEWVTTSMVRAAPGHVHQVFTVFTMNR